MLLLNPIKVIMIPILSREILSNPILPLLKNPVVPAICSSLIVSPIGYSMDKAIINSSLYSTSFYKELVNSLDSLVCKESIITFLGLVSIFTISNIIQNKLIKILICSIVLTPIGIIKDIRMSSISNSKLKDINILTYYGFIIRDTISLFSALIFPSDINLFVHYFYMLVLQIPQTYFHQLGLEYCNKPTKNYKKVKIIKSNFINNIVMRSIKNIIQYGIGIKLNSIFMNILCL